MKNMPLLFAILMLCAAPRAVAEPPPQKIRIGAVVSLTGYAEKNGRNWLEGAQLAIEDLNRDGIACELLVEDDQTTPVKAVTAFTKLAVVDKVQAVVGGTWDFLAEAVFPLAQRYHVPFVTPTRGITISSNRPRLPSSGGSPI